MKTHDNIIKLVKNGRGVWTLDPFTGCPHGTSQNKRGCYGICYARQMDARGGFDFTKLVYRDFENEFEYNKICKKLTKIDFVRIGTMCDPSSDWYHTIKIINKIRPFIKNIVIVTKHWNKLNESQRLQLKGIFVNTSISALDTEGQIIHRLNEYNLLKQFCYSILRVNTCDFLDINLRNKQNELLKNEFVIDNVLRIPSNHELVKKGIIRVEKFKFINNYRFASIHSKDVYFGHCSGCKEKCGINFF